MTKNEAHEKFLRWIEAHPSDKWRISGGDIPVDEMYAGTATINGPDIFARDHIEIDYEAEND